jgi:hypothetical protein
MDPALLSAHNPRLPEMTTPSYATPTDDQIAWREAGHTEVLPAHLVAFLQRGVAVTLGAQGANGRPIVGGGVACRVEAMTEVRVLLSSSGNAAFIEAVRNGSAVAATFSSGSDHRSIQLKASRARIGESAPDDFIEAERQCALLADELVELGYTRLQANAYAQCGTPDLVSLEFRPERVFTQTPGPGAGAELPR